MRAPYSIWWFWAALVVFMVLVAALAGCTTDKVIVVGCPPVVPYPVEVQKQAAAELRALPALAHLTGLPADSPLRHEIDVELTRAGLAPLSQISGPPVLSRFMDDYSRMRDQSRACATS